MSAEQGLYVFIVLCFLLAFFGILLVLVWRENKK